MPVRSPAPLRPGEVVARRRSTGHVPPDLALVDGALVEVDGDVQRLTQTRV